MRLVSSSQASPRLDLVSMLSFLVVVVSSEMVKGFDRGKTRISLFFVESPDYFSWVSRFAFPGVGRSVWCINQIEISD